MKEALTSAQIRAARALIRWSAEDLAKTSGLGLATIRRAELADGTPSMTRVNNQAVRRALEDAGVIFIDANGSGGSGVRLREAHTRDKPENHTAAREPAGKKVSARTRGRR